MLKFHLKNYKMLLTNSQRLSSSFDIIIYGLIEEKDVWHSTDLLNEIFRLLKPNGHLITHVQLQDQTQSQALDRFKMCGFTNCNMLDNQNSFLSTEKSEHDKRSGSIWLCQKPSFDIGYSVPLPMKNGQQKTTTTKVSGGSNKVWKISANDDDDELIDTDELLDDEDRKKPDIKNYDCGTSKTGAKKACKNCTCGLAEELEQEEHQEAKKNIKSSCGSCYLGDAFRCAGCPSRGLPPFQPGDKVSFPTMSDV